MFKVPFVMVSSNYLLIKQLVVVIAVVFNRNNSNGISVVFLFIFPLLIVLSLIFRS